MYSQVFGWWLFTGPVGVWVTAWPMYVRGEGRYFFMTYWYPMFGVWVMATKLLTTDARNADGKISGKAWGRVKNFCCRPGYPKSVFFIIGTEFCERFSYYGMKTILVIYLTKYLLFTDDKATAVYHGFTMLCYFTPIFGAMIADGFLGKFKTILYISIIYCVGNVVMSLTALPPAEAAGPLIGLLLIGIGTGGIKPCVSAFGGDQFSSDQEKELQGFFSVFYFSINAGSLISTFLTPILRADVHCSGDGNCDDCYPLAFGVPAVLMFLSLILFVSGQSLYKRYPPEGNVVGRVAMATGSAVKNKWKNGRNGDKKEHWIHHADSKFEQSFLEDVRAVYRVLFLFIPLPVFWALFDQQGSRWTLQAEKMNGDIGIPGWYVKPDQMQVLNPVLIVCLIPVFENLIYPLLDKCKIPNRPLQRMVAGMTLAAVAFVIAGFIQLKVDGSEVPLTSYQSDVMVINTLPCPATVKSDIYNGTIAIQNATEEMRVKSSSYSAQFSVDKKCSHLNNTELSTVLKLDPEKSFSAIVSSKDGKLVVETFIGHSTKAEKGKALVSIVYTGSTATENMTVHLIHSTDHCKTHNINVTYFSMSAFALIDIGSYSVYVDHGANKTESASNELVVENGGVYNVIIQDDKDGKLIVKEYASLQPNTVSMMLQIPQYFVITVGEIMFSITGLSFAYSQAPPSMKSVLQAGWLMTVAFGNLIVIIIAETSLLPQAEEFFLFSGLMAATILVFTFMAYRYQYVYFERQDDQEMSTAGFANLEVQDESEDDVAQATGNERQEES